MQIRSLVCLFLFAVFTNSGLAQENNLIRIATFQVDATPPLGTPLCDGLVVPAKEIVDPLTARGLIILTEKHPIVLCVFDWVGIGNGGHDAFREALAKAVNTGPEFVTVHAVHQHDAPGCDFTAEKILAAEGLSGACFDPKFARTMVDRVANAAAKAIKKATPVTHVGLGAGIVEKVASNRRILGDDGKVKLVRMSRSKIADAIAAPEGTIDPAVRLVSFWNGDQPLAALMFYATHPMSYYGAGGVSADFAGMARKLREAKLPQTAHLYFNGAGGNVAAGKYNDGSPGRRPLLAQRLAEGMERAWNAQKKHRITAKDVRWDYRAVALPLRSRLENEEKLLAQIRDPKQKTGERVRAARDLAYAQRIKSGHKIQVNCLTLGSGKILFMPGELFVEYQLAAQEMLPDDFVAMAAYGDYGPGYIGTAIAYTQGGYETGNVSRTAPEVENVLIAAMRGLLRAEDR